jgi:hypothetical protein
MEFTIPALFERFVLLKKRTPFGGQDSLPAMQPAAFSFANVGDGLPTVGCGLDLFANMEQHSLLLARQEAI